MIYCTPFRPDINPAAIVKGQFRDPEFREWFESLGVHPKHRLPILGESEVANIEGPHRFPFCFREVRPVIVVLGYDRSVVLPNIGLSYVESTFH